MLICIKNGYGSINSSFPIGPAVWPHFDLIFVHSGQIQLKLMDGKHEQIKAGRAVLLYPETPFTGYPITPLARISVHHFRLNKSCNLRVTVTSLRGKNNGYEICQPCDNSKIEQDIDRIIMLAHETPLVLKREIRSILMTLIITQLFSETNQIKLKSELSPEFKKLTDGIKKNPTVNITLDDMAAQIGYSTSHFRSVFKKQIGMSPGKYLFNLRMNEAARLLRETLVPIKNIARLAGYKDITHFYHAFKANYKTTPAAYRSQHLPVG